MASPSFFERKKAKPQARSASDPLAEEAGPVQQARAQARRRLIGAVLLLAIGVIVFPLLFETQPRPLPGAIPIEMPPREGADARSAARPGELALPPSASPSTVAQAAAAARPASAVPSPPAATPSPAAVTDAAPATSARTADSTRPGDAGKAEQAEKLEKPAKAEQAANAGPSAKDAAPGHAALARKGDDERARALLEGRPAAATPAAAVPMPASAAASAAQRFVVQVGAYGDAATLRQVRAKVEKLGLETYIQTVQTQGGPRTRLRVGPFGSRHEAEKANDKLAAAGLRGNLLTL